MFPWTSSLQNSTSKQMNLVGSWILATSMNHRFMVNVSHVRFPVCFSRNIYIYGYLTVTCRYPFLHEHLRWHNGDSSRQDISALRCEEIMRAFPPLRSLMADIVILVPRPQEAPVPWRESVVNPWGGGWDREWNASWILRPESGEYRDPPPPDGRWSRCSPPLPAVLLTERQIDFIQMKFSNWIYLYWTNPSRVSMSFILMVVISKNKNENCLFLLPASLQRANQETAEQGGSTTLLPLFWLP